MPAYGYEFYLLLVNSISHSFAALSGEISSWPLEDKIHIHARACNILYLSACGQWPGLWSQGVSQQGSTSRAPRSSAREESNAFDGHITRVVEPGSRATSSNNIELRRSTRRKTQVETSWTYIIFVCCISTTHLRVAHRWNWNLLPKAEMEQRFSFYFLQCITFL